jgi:hypothetical protein
VVPDFPSDDTSSAPREDPLIFVSDASAEAERLTTALRSRGYVVVDVPLALLVGRVAVQKPAIILCDVDAPGALEQVRRLRDVPFGGQVDIIFLGEPGRTLDEQKDAVFHESSGFFVRPVDTFGLVRKVEALVGAPSRPGIEARFVAGPSSRPPMHSSRPASVPPVRPKTPTPREPSAPPEPPKAAAPSAPPEPPKAAAPSAPPEPPKEATPREPSAPPEAPKEATPAQSSAPPERPKTPTPREPSDPPEQLGAPSARATTAPPIRAKRQKMDEASAAARSVPTSPEASPQPIPVPPGLDVSSEPPVLPAQPSTTPPRRPHSPIPSSSPSSAPGRLSSSPSSMPLSDQSLPAAIPLGFASDERGASPLARHIPQSEISAELEGILARAEQRIGTKGRGSAPAPSLRLPPEAEVEAVLPADVLAALDEPLEAEEEEDSASGTGRGWGSGGSTGGSVRTGMGTGAGSMSGTIGTGSGTAGQIPAPASVAGAMQVVSADTDTPAGPEEGAPPTPPAARPRVPAPPSAPAMSIMTAVEAKPTSGRLSEREGPPTAVARPTPLPPSMGPEALVGWGTAERSAPVAAPAPAPKASPTPEIPAVLGEGDAAVAIARAIRSRFTGALAFENELGIRRVVLRDGDFVTAASGAAHESLVAFLAERGTFGPDVAKSLGHKLPAFGRHAGAALIAHGHLRQDELWPILRAHAEWLVGVIIGMTAGGASLERDVPARLEAEPAVFGGATGAEVFVEVVRRVVLPDRAIALLGGSGTRLVDGPNPALLGECALGEAELALVSRCRSNPLSQTLENSPNRDFVTVLWALALLGVLEAVGPSARATPAPAQKAKPEPDSYDNLAVRTRILARKALVEEGDYFALLGLGRNATSYDVERAYTELRKEFEPSRILTAGTADLKSDVDLILEVIDEAFEILGHPQRRERYRRAVEAMP